MKNSPRSRALRRVRQISRRREEPARQRRVIQQPLRATRQQREHLLRDVFGEMSISFELARGGCMNEWQMTLDQSSKRSLVGLMDKPAQQRGVVWGVHFSQ
jgi:hypothetical protein